MNADEPGSDQIVQSYVVFEPPRPPANRVKHAERLVFVREGFSWTAAVLGPLWMLVSRTWLALFLYVVAVLVLFASLRAAEVGAPWITVSMIALHLAIGFEAGTLRRWALQRRRWRMLGAVVGPTRFDCERRFFQTWLGERTDERDKSSVRLATPPQQAATEEPGSTADAGPEPAASKA